MARKQTFNKKNITSFSNGEPIDFNEFVDSFTSNLPDQPGTINTLERKKEKFASHGSKRNRNIQRERGIYGLGTSDLWNFSPSYIWYCFAQVCRAYPSDSSQKILKDSIFLLNDLDSWDFFADKDKMREYMSNKHEEYELEYDAVRARWAKNYSPMLVSVPQAHVSDADYIHDLSAIRSVKTRSDLRWAQWRGVFTDPTSIVLADLKDTVEKEQYNKIVKKHRKQRISFRISDMDISSNPLAYIHLGIVNAAIYISSTEVHGWPSYTGDTWEEYSDRMLKFAEGIYIAGFAANRNLSKEDKKIRDKAISDMPELLIGMWD